MNSKEIKLTWDTAEKITGLIYEQELDRETTTEFIEAQLRVFKLKLKTKKQSKETKEMLIKYENSLIK